MIFFYLVSILFFSLVLIKATDILIINFKALAARTRLGQFAITELFLALATSLPEYFVGITAALKQSPALSLGNVLGANIANLSLVIGGGALIGGTIFVQGNLLGRDILYTLLTGSAPLLLLLDKDLSRVDGLILLFLYGFYQVNIFREREKNRVEVESEGFVQRLLRRLNHRSAKREIGWIFLGVAILLFSADMIVRFSASLATLLNVPVLLIGLILISIGTTLPELVFGIEAIKQHQPGMVLGNLLGSIVTNATLIIGTVALIYPVEVVAFNEYLLATLAFFVVFSSFYLFTASKRRLDRWEGVVLIIFYFLFAFAEFFRS